MKILTSIKNTILCNAFTMMLKQNCKYRAQRDSVLKKYKKLQSEYLEGIGHAKLRLQELRAENARLRKELKRTEAERRPIPKEFLERSPRKSLNVSV